jgi:hypothetical protein
MLLIGYRNYIFRLSLVLVRFRNDGYMSFLDIIFSCEDTNSSPVPQKKI